MDDAFTPYKAGLTRLLELLGKDHPRYTEALVYQQRLQDNIAQARRYGDTETRRAERAQIVDVLNRLTLEILKQSFNELCGLSAEFSSISITEATIKPETELGVQTWWGEKYYGKFVGHESEINSLLELLTESDTPAVLAITAMGGMGKTAFCRELVGRAYERSLFVDIAWVRARMEQFGAFGEPSQQRRSRLTTEETIKEICVELRIPHRQALDPARLRQKLHQVLKEERYLIVVDGLEDAESPQSASKELSQILGRSRALLTSRERVGVSAMEFKLRKLNHEEARNFIWQVASERYALPEQNPLLHATESQVEAMLEVTDGMPLAIKLIVSQADFLDLDRLIARLIDVQVEGMLYDYIFDASWAKLEQDEDWDTQQLLILLASRVRPVPIHLLYGMGGLSAAQVDHALEKLTHYSLVEVTAHDPGRRQVGLHSLTRRYVNETLRQRYE